MARRAVRAANMLGGSWGKRGERERREVTKSEERGQERAASARLTAPFPRSRSSPKLSFVPFTARLCCTTLTRLKPLEFTAQPLRYCPTPTTAHDYVEPRRRQSSSLVSRCSHH